VAVRVVAVVAIAAVPVVARGHLVPALVPAGQVDRAGAAGPVAPAVRSAGVAASRRGESPSGRSARSSTTSPPRR
jgi:hypothetical protein